MTDKTTTIRIAVVTTSSGRYAVMEIPPGEDGTVDWSTIKLLDAMDALVPLGNDAVKRSIVTATVPLPEPTAEVEADSVEEVG